MKESDLGVKWFNTIFYPQKKTGRAVRYEDGILPRLRQQTVTLFTPWGPRYSWEERGVVIQEGDKELEVLNFLATILDEWQRNMPEKNFRWVFLGADLYGTKINNLPCEVVSRYFISLAEWLKRILPRTECWLWSKYDAEVEPYRQRVFIDFRKYVGFDLLAQATQTARAMKRGGSPEVYLVERIAEAMFIEKALCPIKVSCVSRRKDDEVDMELPRLYLLPERLHAPWM